MTTWGGVRARVLVLALASVLGMMVFGATATEAATYCLDSGDITQFQIEDFVVVVKDFIKPAAGKCELYAGYRGDGTVAVPASVTACMNSQKSRLYVGLDIHPFKSHKPGPGFFSVRMGFDFPHPALTGAHVAYQTEDGSLASGLKADSSFRPYTVFPMP